MDAAAANAKKNELDRALIGSDPSVGIAFGQGLFKEFRDRGGLR
jgi:hypothetical protein